MKKVLDQELEMAIKKKTPSEVIALLKELQDASGLKVCTAVTTTDPAYRKVS
jgi:hypothetical protein